MENLTYTTTFLFVNYQQKNIFSNLERKICEYRFGYFFFDV